jgi:hypothetical protein
LYFNQANTLEIQVPDMVKKKKRSKIISQQHSPNEEELEEALEWYVTKKLLKVANCYVSSCTEFKVFVEGWNH